MNNDNTAINSQVNKFRQDTVKQVIKKVLKNYVVLDKNLDKVDEESLMTEILRQDEPERCSGVVSSGTKFSQCTRNASNDLGYCKIHAKKYQSNQSYQKVEEVKGEKLYLVKTEVKNSSTRLKKVFIEDSFYFVDDNFIYDKSNESLSKVGYVDKGNYILTDDPFILNYKGECFL